MIDRLIQQPNLSFSRRLALDVLILIRDADRKTRHGDVAVRPKINEWLGRVIQRDDHLNARAYYALAERPLPSPEPEGMFDDFKGKDSATKLLRDIRLDLGLAKKEV